MEQAGNQQNQQLVERLLDDLHKLMWTMVWDVANSNRWQLEPEEVYAELCLELVKLVSRYHDKPFIELKRLSVTSMRNRVHDLATACYLTNRRAESAMESLDAADVDDDGQVAQETYYIRHASGGTNSLSVDNTFSMSEFCDGMSDDARTLVKEVLFPSARTMHFLQLTAQRKQAVAPKGFWTLTITPLVMTRSLGWTNGRLRLAWDEISRVVSSDFDGGLVAKEDIIGQ